MVRLLVSRLLQTVILLYLLLTLLFFLLRLSGDPVTSLIGGQATEATIKQLRHAYGFDRPLPSQYWIYIRHAVVLDFGRSVRSFQPGMHMALSRVPASVYLSLVTFAIVIVVAFPLGIMAAVARSKVRSSAVMFVALIGQSVPSFYLAVLLIFFLAVKVHWLPAFGYGSPRQFVLPAITLALYPIARYTRLIRSQMLEVLSQDYVRTARAKGLRTRTVLLRHALRNALLPFVTFFGLEIGAFVGGSVIAETVFAWPGVGQQLVQAASARDYPVVEATAFLIAVSVCLSNIAVDVVYGIIDPRIQLSS